MPGTPGGARYVPLPPAAPWPPCLLCPAAAAMIPNPFSVLYASTKSFLSCTPAAAAAPRRASGGAATACYGRALPPPLPAYELTCTCPAALPPPCRPRAAFGASLAAEVRPYGIDVLVFHPSPVATRFYDKVRPLSHTRTAHCCGAACAACAPAACASLALACPAPAPPRNRLHACRRRLDAACVAPRHLPLNHMLIPLCPAQAHKLDAMEFFKRFAVDPDELPDTGGLWVGGGWMGGRIPCGRGRGMRPPGTAPRAGVRLERPTCAAVGLWLAPQPCLPCACPARPQCLPPLAVSCGAMWAPPLSASACS